MADRFARLIIPTAAGLYTLCALVAFGHWMNQPCPVNNTPAQCENNRIAAVMFIVPFWPFYASMELQKP